MNPKTRSFSSFPSTAINHRTWLGGAASLAATSPFAHGLHADNAPAPVLPQNPNKGIDAGWSMVVFPDTQNYAKYGKNQEHFVRMCRWVAEHADAWRIKLALHEGDLVEQNNIAEGGGRGYGDQHSESQWTSSRRALSQLYGIMPVLHGTGNHDYGIRNAENRETRFNEFFKITDNPRVSDGKGGGVLVECGPNAFGQRTMENTASAFTAPDGRKLLIIALEWGPRRAAVEWAKGILNRPNFANHTGILLVHDFIKPGNLRSGQEEGDREKSGNPHKYPTGSEGDTHDGENLWQSLVHDAPQVQLVFNGHYMGSHVGRRTDPNRNGLPVHQMLFNAQGFGGGSAEKGNGGDGWMRLVTFEPDQRSLSVRTFSPLKMDFGESPWWDHPDWCFSLALPAISGT